MKKIIPFITLAFFLMISPLSAGNLLDIHRPGFVENTAPSQGKEPFSIFPNPASTNYISIISKDKSAKEVSVFDILGKEVIKTTLTTEQLDISGLKSGMYILKIVQGKASMTKKLVIE